MNIGVLIFSRYDSTRLPGKALLKINGQELLGRVIDRSKKLTGVEGVVVATSDRKTDDVIADFAKSQGVEVFRGNVNDVAKRAIDACNYYGWDAFVRICGDRPFYDVSIVRSSIENMSYRRCDLVTTSGEYMLPPGLTTEVVLCSALEKYYEFFQASHKEHLTSFLYERAGSFDIRYLDYPNICKAVYPTSLVVDTDKDLHRAEWVAKKLELSNPIPEQSARTVLELAKLWDKNHFLNVN
ncbi:NTP transferase domain-containing protein [Vibrio sp. S4M6]|uniref:cytidylyltransferase domain-containing protein n=1 Tax=Vibrio sinus TaxID=2946865 RepID=UPI00202A5AA7|nr:NTP transferase domain-containing protein [Vibrio sinus]MCL9781543.1 NTP transferase domain-containing protein [Vibrio sinus]